AADRSPDAALTRTRVTACWLSMAPHSPRGRTAATDLVSPCGWQDRLTRAGDTVEHGVAPPSTQRRRLQRLKRLAARSRRWAGGTAAPSRGGAGCGASRTADPACAPTPRRQAGTPPRRWDARRG